MNFEANGRLMTASHQAPSGNEIRYRLEYRVSEVAVEIVASALGSAAPLRLVLPMVARNDEAVAQPDAKTVRIAKNAGAIVVRTDAEGVFDAVPRERTFNLVPGFECAPVVVALAPGKETRVRIEAV